MAFWEALPHARLTNVDVGTRTVQTLQLQNGTSFLGERSYGDRLMIRHCYQDLIATCEEKFNTGSTGVIIVGTPGATYEPTAHAPVISDSWCRCDC